MGMYAKLRRFPVLELEAAKEDPAKFYRTLFGIKGKASDRGAMLQSLGLQMGAAIKASPLGREFTDMPEVRRVAEAMLHGRAPDEADQKVVAEKMIALLPKIGFRID